MYEYKPFYCDSGALIKLKNIEQIAIGPLNYLYTFKTATDSKTALTVNLFYFLTLLSISKIKKLSMMMQ